MKTKMLMSMMIIALGAAVVGGATMAWFTDTEEATENTFTAGELSIDDEVGDFADLGTLDNMAPGDTTDSVTLEITNDGNLDLAWFGKWQFEAEGSIDKLKEAIYINKMEYSSPHRPDETIVEDGGDPVEDFFTEDEISESGKVTLDNFRLNGMLPASEEYHHPGALAADEDEPVEIVVSFGFDRNAGNDYQGDQVDPIEIGFEVDATQLELDAMNELLDFELNDKDWYQGLVDGEQE